MVLLVLAIIWAALLISWFRSHRSVETLSDSVGTFRRHLTVLEKASPSTVPAANRLRDGRISRSHGADRSLGMPGPRPAPGLSGRPGQARPARGRPMNRSVAAQQVVLRRRQAQRRRRDVFFALLAGAAGSFALALVPGLSVMWAVQVVFDLLFAGYVAILLRLRNRAVERDLKLRFLPNQAHRPVRAARQYELAAVGYGYGDMDLHQAVR